MSSAGNVKSVHIRIQGVHDVHEVHGVQEDNGHDTCTEDIMSVSTPVPAPPASAPVPVSAPSSGLSTTTVQNNTPRVSWLNRTVNNLQMAVLDSNNLLSNSRSAPEILTSNVRAYLGPTSDIYVVRSQESGPRIESHINITDDTNESVNGESGNSDQENTGENGEESNPDDNNDPVMDRRGIIRMSMKESMRNASFILILILKLAYDHFDGLFMFASLFSIFFHVNKETGSAIAFHTNLSVKRVCLTLFAIAGCIFFILCVSDYGIHYSGALIFLPPPSEPASVWKLFWVVCMSDLFLKFVTVNVKILIACEPTRLMNFSQRAKLYSLVEQIFRLYRSLVPILPWLYYLFNSYEGYDKITGVFLCVIYIIAKVEYLYRKIVFFTKYLKDVFSQEDICISSNLEHLENGDNLCSICHDKYKSPVTMICSHVFCESCISRWLNKSKTCPLCRSPIIKDFHWRSGYTSICLQFW